MTHRWLAAAVVVLSYPALSALPAQPAGVATGPPAGPTAVTAAPAVLAAAATAATKPRPAAALTAGTASYASRRAAISTRWAADFATLQRSLSGPAGVSMLPVGASASTAAITVGSWHHGVAWSTSKVPLSVAALRKSSSASTKTLVHRAITVSDNAAAESLWRRLGSGRAAGNAVQRVVRAAGDRRTVVQYRRVRPPFTAFGQTDWALADQARFGAGLSCLAGAKPVIGEMSHITASQRWGLGRLKHTPFKGGWGPVGNGYLVRQVGIVTMPDDRLVAVAIAVWSPKGFTRGTRDLTAIANWLGKRLPAVPGGRCSASTARPTNDRSSSPTLSRNGIP